MANIFLSYARADKVKANVFAKALEQAGHDVWWDQHVRGGSEFAGEIEAALARADHVVVLWSKTSVKSAWVRDEASEGLASGRLLPIMIDSSRPPMGFRQVQSLDFSHWRSNEPAPLAPLLAAMAGKDHPSQTPPRRLRLARRKFGLAAALTAAVLIAASVLLWQFSHLWRARDPTPTIAVLPFADLSEKGDQAYLAEGVGETILSMVSREPGLNVIGRTSAAQFRGKSTDLARMREALGVTHVLEGSVQTAATQLRMSVRLIDAGNGKQLWAEDYQRPLSNIFALQDEVAGAVAKRLTGTLGQNIRRVAPPITADTYTFYLAARAKMRSRKQQELREALELGRQLTRTDPNYAAGYALQAETLWLQSEYLYGSLPRDKVARVAIPLAEKAIRLAPDSPDGYAALGGIRLFREPAAAIEPLKRALALDPSRSDLRTWLALAYGGSGRNVEALREYEAALAMDPLSPGLIIAFVPALAGGGRFDDARALIDAYQQRGGFSNIAIRMRSMLAFQRGDLSNAAKLMSEALAIDKQTPGAQRMLGYTYFQLGLHDRSASIASNLPLFALLRASGRDEELVRAVRAMGPRVWEEPFVDVAFSALAMKRDWASIVTAFEANPEFAKVLCGGLESSMNLAVIVALREVGRARDAAPLLRCQKEWLAKATRGPVGQSGAPLALVDSWRAHVLAIEGREADAFAMMNKAVDEGFLTPLGKGLSPLPTFDRYRANPAYAALDARLKKIIARERAEFDRDPA